MSVQPIRSSRVAGVKRVRGAARGIKAPMPSAVIRPQNSSVGSTVRGLFQSYEPLAYYLPFEILDWVELLARYNPDYSQAVDNIITLANSGHDLFAQGASDLQTKRVKALLEEKARGWQESAGGVDGIFDKLLNQSATFGAMCGEWLLDEDLGDVVDFADISPKTIRFFWDDKLRRFAPFQKMSGQDLKDAENRGQEIRSGCARLNEITFAYYGFNNAPSSPYGTPPFIAALGNIGIQSDMVGNLAKIVKKIGLLGIVDAKVDALQPSPGESDDDFEARAQEYLTSYVEAVEQMVEDGGMVHFDDLEVTTYNIGGNAAGATNIFKTNEELVFSGLKSMPSVQGRSYSTTETYAGVAYDIIIRNTKRYQRACKRMMERGYWLAATMASLQPQSIGLSFKENKTLHRLQDAQAEQMELKNGLTKWAAGYIDQRTAAQEAGYSDVATPYDEPPDSKLLGNAGDANTGTPGSDGGNQDPVGGGNPSARRSGDYEAWYEAGVEAAGEGSVVDHRSEE